MVSAASMLQDQSLEGLEIQQANASTFYVKVNTDNIGYNLESDDEIVAWGRFNS